jgi:ATP adenylyltransferase
MPATGDLWNALVQASDRALRSGALQPIPTSLEYLDDGGVRFLVRRLASIERKKRATATQRGNPFLPYEPEMFVADVSDTHVALLNRFNVVEHHLLIVTRTFEHQDELLTPADFEALWTCMADYDALGFYNGGSEAGASQPHKHLQMIPLPMAPEGPAIPIEPIVQAAKPNDTPSVCPALPFRHAVVRSEPAASRDRYLRLLESVGLTTDRPPRPYNLLVTRDWMLLVPRAREHFETISLNAIAYAGGLLVRNDEEITVVRDHGPMAVLTAVGVRDRTV